MGRARKAGARCADRGGYRRDDPSAQRSRSHADDGQSDISIRTRPGPKRTTRGGDTTDRGGFTLEELWAVGVYDLGLKTKAFWGMTPRQFHLLLKRHEHRVRSEDRRSGEVVSILYNINRDAEKDPKGIGWRDVFPEWKEPTREQTEEEMFAAMLVLAKSTKGLTS